MNRFLKLRNSAVACLVGATTILLAGAGAAVAQYPVSTLHVIVPYGPGGAGDVVGRVVANELGRRLNVTTVVENVPGAGGTIGAAQVARSDNDGSVILLAGNAIITTAPHISDPGFDPLNDLVAIANVSEAVRMLASSPSLPVSNYEEFIAYAKEHPGELNYGTAGVGTTGHITTLDFLAAAGIEAEHIPYSGSALAIQALLSGDVQFSIDATTVRHAKEGSVTPLAVPGDNRVADFPDIPTFEELGLADVRGSGLQAIMGPAGMPQEAIDMVEEALREALETEEFKQSLINAGVAPRYMGGEELASHLAEEYEYVGPVLESIGLADQ